MRGVVPTVMLIRPRRLHVAHAGFGDAFYVVEHAARLELGTVNF